MAIITKRIGNKTKLYVAAIAETPSWTEVLGAKEIGTPKQTYSAVDLEELNQTDDITEATRGTRDAGEITAQVNTKSSTNAGLTMILAAKESGDELAVKIEYSDDDIAICSRAIVLGCEVSDVSSDTELYYDITMRPNAKMEVQA